MWIYPSTESLNEIIKSDMKKSKELNKHAHEAVVTGSDHDTKFRGYKIVDHFHSEVHDKFRKDYMMWMKRKLAFRPSVDRAVKDTLETIGNRSQRFLTDNGFKGCDIFSPQDGPKPARGHIRWHT